MEAIEMLSETLALENCPSVNKLTMTSLGKYCLASSDKAKEIIFRGCFYLVSYHSIIHVSTLSLI